MADLPLRSPKRILMPAPALSVIVPTCGRATSLRRLMRALHVQRDAPPFEVVIVADGVRTAGTGVGDPLAWPFSVRVIEVPSGGAATARNAGAAAARAPVILFLDDDVEPGAGVVSAHVVFHESREEAAIAVGELAPCPAESGFLGGALSGWWEVMNDRLADPRHRFTFRDLLTGHCSMRRSTFERVGPFDAALRCQEDFDFGYRAIEAGVELRYVREARGLHHDDSDLDKILRRKFDEGVASVQLSVKHPRLLPAFPLGRPLASARLATWVHEAAAHETRGHVLLPKSLRLAMRSFESLSMRDKWRAALERLMDYWYWRGVRHQASGSAAIHEFRASRPAANRTLLELDLGAGIEAAERQVDEVRPQGVRITLDGWLVGELPEQPGAERLRGVHLRPLLLKDFPIELAAAAKQARLLPLPFHGCVAVARDASERSTVPEPGRAA